MHLNARACLEFQRKSQDDVRLSAFRVCEEKDFSHGRFSALRGKLVRVSGIQAR